MDSIIFDVDGTMWDTTAVVAKAWITCILEETGIPYEVTPSYLKTQFGKLLSEIADDLFSKEPPEIRTHLITRCCEREHEALLKNAPAPYDGMEKALQQLSQKYSLFLVSNCQAGYIELFLEATGFGKYMKGHLCPGDTGNGKADNIKEIISTYNLNSPVYVGDTMGDFSATKAAGIPFVFAEYGFGILETDPDYSIATPLDLLYLF